jgi:membrane protein implicated in regulation of membrane protease activity
MNRLTPADLLLVFALAALLLASIWLCNSLQFPASIIVSMVLR